MGRWKEKVLAAAKKGIIREKIRRGQRDGGQQGRKTDARKVDCRKVQGARKRGKEEGLLKQLGQLQKRKKAAKEEDQKGEEGIEKELRKIREQGGTSCIWTCEREEKAAKVE